MEMGVERRRTMEESWVVVMSKPSRSEEIIVSPEEQLLTSERVRAHFESIAPKKPMKPDRSDPTAVDPQLLLSQDPVHHPPQLERLQSLKSEPEPVFSEEGQLIMSVEEFVETDYYKKLNSIDKEHYVPGSGYIKVVQGGGEGPMFNSTVVGSSIHGRTLMEFKTNPATNDWIPKSAEYHQGVAFVSKKPNRSESE